MFSVESVSSASVPIIKRQDRPLRPHSFLIVDWLQHSSCDTLHSRRFSKSQFFVPNEVLRSTVNCLTFDGKTVTWLAYQFLLSVTSRCVHRFHRKRCAVYFITHVYAYKSVCFSRSAVFRFSLRPSLRSRTILAAGVLPDYSVCRGLCKLPRGSAWFLPHTQRTHMSSRAVTRIAHV